ncbi:type II toxin-antitoxin system Phd/YefM family antitoxin [Lactobacillus reuteri]|uniref:type II toxin-antitoxin system Phd/YefM family antitoxin n=1 Tax=Limosilactobacillus reuteri TaxID=1598 RepID=UPI00146F36C2|nr:type II toxin-antitoxin system prevent-host-death family antitoxin [Limosilactobacillus reuteri]NMV53534.1 type II toxin-antitoxin system Phd/YefM family antitoxin [Limosilactobacillus reuteri]NMV57099.1 type II toxin-antitoxin system Phd/YefM family antitoxin [Limosilactobacillus reuteri]
MDNIVTPAQAQREFFELIKKVNEDRHPILVKPTKAGEKGSVIVGEDDWKAIQEKLHQQ